MTYIFLSYFLLMSCVCYCDMGLFDDEFGSNKENWVDPHDMFNYDPISKKMKENTYSQDRNKRKNNGNHDEPQNCPTQPAEEVLNAEKLISALPKFADDPSLILYLIKYCEQNMPIKNDQKYSIFEKYPSIPSPQDSVGSIYLKQYIKVLLNGMMPEIPDGEKVYYSIELKLDNGDLHALKLFADSDGGSIQDAHSALLKIVSIIHQSGGYQPPSIDERLLEFIGGQSTLMILVGISASFFVSAWMLTHIHVFSYGFVVKFFWSVMFILFFISIPWNWWYLYQLKVAEKHAVVLKTVPGHCQHGASAWYSFKSFFSVEEDPCEKYFKGLMVNPLTEVPPMKAIAVTITRMILEPLEHIGESINLLIKKSLDGLPFHLQIVVLLIIVFLVVFILLLACGYRIGGLFNLIDLQPQSRMIANGAAMPSIAYPAPSSRVQDLPCLRNDDNAATKNNCDQTDSKPLRIIAMQDSNDEVTSTSNKTRTDNKIFSNNDKKDSNVNMDKAGTIVGSYNENIEDDFDMCQSLTKDLPTKKITSDELLKKENAVILDDTEYKYDKVDSNPLKSISSHDLNDVSTTLNEPETKIESKINCNKIDGNINMEKSVTIGSSCYEKSDIDDEFDMCRSLANNLPAIKIINEELLKKNKTVISDDPDSDIEVIDDIKSSTH